MTSFATEDYYKNEYLCGKKAVIDTAFSFYARSATAEIKRYTGQNIDESNVPDCVKNCCCELAELIYEHEKTAAESGRKSSESVGGWSVSYESREQSEQSFYSSVENCIYKWLSATGLLFTGVKRC